jgi:hypothetical protein
MIGPAHDLKVFWPIIGVIPVYVMHVLLWLEKTSNQPFHNNPMFKNVPVDIRRWVGFVHDSQIPAIPGTLHAALPSRAVFPRP